MINIIKKFLSISIISSLNYNINLYNFKKLRSYLDSFIFKFFFNLNLKGLMLFNSAPLSFNFFNYMKYKYLFIFLFFLI